MFLNALPGVSQFQGKEGGGGIGHASMAVEVVDRGEGRGEEESHGRQAGKSPSMAGKACEGWQMQAHAVCQKHKQQYRLVEI
eukprot:747107-Hanusia_phi.AAC.8